MDPQKEKQVQQQQLPEKVREEKLLSLQKEGGYKKLVEPIIPKEIKKYIKHFSDEADLEEKGWFLEDPDYAEPRKDLKASLRTLIDILQSSDGLEQIEAVASQKKKEAEALRNKNLGKILAKARPLEKTYRELDVFYQNAGPEDVENLVILNVDREMLLNKDEQDVKEKVRELLRKPALAIDQDKVFSFLVIPEFLGEDLITAYGQMAHEYKVLFLTDYKDAKSIEDIVDYRDGKKGEKIGGPQAFWSHVVVYANHLILREKFLELGEKDDLPGSPAIAIAGGLYSLAKNLAQPFAGYLKGDIKNIVGLRIDDVNQPQVAELSKRGLNALVNAFQQNMAFEARTLFNGKNPELINYAVVRTFDYIDKSLKHFLNQNIFAVLTHDHSRRIQQSIIDFLDELKEDKVINRGQITRFVPDRKRPDIIHIDFEIEPLWAARAFLYKLEVSKDKKAESTEPE